MNNNSTDKTAHIWVLICALMVVKVEDTYIYDEKL